MGDTRTSLLGSGLRELGFGLREGGVLLKGFVGLCSGGVCVPWVLRDDFRCRVCAPCLEMLVYHLVP